MHKGHPSSYSVPNMYSLPQSNFEESPGDSSTSNIGMMEDILDDPTGLDWVSEKNHSLTATN